MLVESISSRVNLGQVLVTGASGFIGSHLRHGNIAMVRGAAQAGEISADLLDFDSLKRACIGIDTIIHCAGYAHAFDDKDPERYWRINFEGTKNLLQAASESDVKRFIFLSSVKASESVGAEYAGNSLINRPLSPYGLSKRAAEVEVLNVGQASDMHVVNLRLAMVYGHGGKGNLERMAHAIKKGWFPPLPKTDNRRSVVHVNDVISAIYACAKNPLANGKTYVVCDLSCYSTKEIYDTIRRELKLPLQRFTVPILSLRAGGQLGDWMQRILKRSLPLNSDVISKLIDSECYSAEPLKQELGWSTSINLTEGIREMLNDKKAL
jgi:nucleoside-diphosphate-sugar epimerase